MPSIYADKVAACEQILGFSFKDKLHCAEALQMSGNHIVWNDELISLRKNEGLAVLGDTVLKSSVQEMVLDWEKQRFVFHQNAGTLLSCQ